MLKHNKKNILKIKLKKLILLKFIYNNIIKKSIFHNRNIKIKNKFTVYITIKKKTLTRNKVKNLCLMTGKKKSINKKILLSRQYINQTCKLNNLQNFKINS
jgi:ribosomal protein S14